MRVAVCLLALAGVAFADEVHLRDGAVLIGHAEDKGNVVVITRRGNRITVPRHMVLKIVPGPLPEELYAGRKEKIAEGDVAGHLELAHWCELMSLLDEAKEQYREVLRFDPVHDEAHQSLGHIKLDDGRWVTEEEAMKAAGMVRFRGKWVTEEERDAILRREAEEGRRKELRRRIRRSLNNLSSRNEKKQAEALETLSKIEWPDKLGLFLSALTGGVVKVRRYVAESLAKCPDPEAIPTLVHVWLHDQDDEVRRLAGASVRGRKDPETAFIPLLNGLFSDRMQVRSRTLEALRARPDPRAVPYLLALWQHNLAEADINFSENPAGQAKILKRDHTLPDGSNRYFPRRMIARHPMEGFRDKLLERERAAVAEENGKIHETLTGIVGKDHGDTFKAWNEWHKEKRRAEKKEKKK